MTFADDGMLVTGDEAGTLRRWSAADGSAIGAPLVDRVGPVRSLVNVPTPTLTVLVSAGGEVNWGGDGRLRRWNLASATPVVPDLDTGHNGRSRCEAAPFDGRTVVVSGGNSGELMMWDPDSGELIRRAETGRYPVSGLAVGTVLGRTVVAISRDIIDPMRFWDVDSWSEVDLAAEDLQFHTVRGLVIDRLARATLVTVDGDHSLHLSRLTQRTWRPHRVHHPAPVTAVAVASVPQPIVVAAYHDRTVRLINPTTGSLLAEPLEFEESVRALAIGVDGSIAAGFGIDVAIVTPELP
jgi:WD40 repeat protein